MLVALHHRFGLSPEERRHFRQVYGGPWVMVRDLLRRRNEQTTRTVYLEPLNGLQVRSMLDHDEDLETLLSRVAAPHADPAGEDTLWPAAGTLGGPRCLPRASPGNASSTRPSSFGSWESAS
jgi:hypothetical protein